MNKGKLYEYIKNGMYSPGYHDPYVIATRYIDEYLNEAKKEFYEIWKNRRYAENIVEELEEWGKKWLGDKK
jgi:hypothetical protein